MTWRCQWWKGTKITTTTLEQRIQEIKAKATRMGKDLTIYADQEAVNIIPHFNDQPTAPIQFPTEEVLAKTPAQTLDEVYETIYKLRELGWL